MNARQANFKNEMTGSRSTPTRGTYPRFYSGTYTIIAFPSIHQITIQNRHGNTQPSIPDPAP